MRKGKETQKSESVKTSRYWTFVRSTAQEVSGWPDWKLGTTQERKVRQDTPEREKGDEGRRGSSAHKIQF
jgi:hypothetical protein